MSNRVLRRIFAAGLVLLAAFSFSQETPTQKQNGAEQPTPYQSMTPDQRAAATRAFLGLGAEPDRAAAARGEPLFQKNCAVCHGAKARGAMGPSLITSDQVLADNHGELLAPYIKAGRPDKGMPSFSSLQETELKDIAEYLHLQVEEVANRGAYRVLNIAVGNAAKGQAYIGAHCSSCHTADTFAHFATRFATPEQLQRAWIWPGRSASKSLALTANVKTADGAILSGRVTQISDFQIVLIDSSGATHTINRAPGVEVQITDPLEPHQKLILALANDDMHNVTAYLETLK